MIDVMVDAFLAYCKIEKGLTEYTINAYGHDLKVLTDYFEKIDIMDPVLVKRKHLSEWIEHLNTLDLSQRSINRYRISMRQFFKFLAMEDYIDENPTHQLISPKVARPLPKSMSTDDVESLLAQPNRKKLIGIRDAAMFELMYSTGMRVSELVNLRREQWHDGWIEVEGKRGKQRIIPFGDRAGDLVSE